MSTIKYQRLEKPQAVLFDHDGVLVASEPLHLDAWKQLCVTHLYIPFDEVLIRTLVGKTSPEILKSLLHYHDPKRVFTDDDLQEFSKIKNSFYLKNVGQLLIAYPGVLDGIRWLKSQNIKTAVVSNARQKELHEGLKKIEAFELIDAVFSREDVPAAKPDPRAYLFAANYLGVEPKNCYVVEDSPTGIQSGLIAQIPSIAVTTNFTSDFFVAPVPGRPDLIPLAIFDTIADFFEAMKLP